MLTKIKDVVDDATLLESEIASLEADLEFAASLINEPSRVFTSFPRGSKHRSLTTLARCKVLYTDERMEVFKRPHANILFVTFVEKETSKFRDQFEKEIKINQIGIALFTPGFSFNWHTDHFPTLRWHIPIKTNRKCFLESREAKVHMEKFSLWTLDSSKDHRAYNNGKDNRLHLIADYAEPPVCEKLDVSFNFEEVYKCVKPVCDKIKGYRKEYHSTDIVRIMSAYPIGCPHYTSQKRKDETWEVIDNDEVTTYTRSTKFGTIMVSAYWKGTVVWDQPVLDLIEKIRTLYNEEGIAQVAVIMAGENFRLERHVDTKGLTRYHVPLETNEHSYFVTYDPETKWWPKEGDVWRLETDKYHAAMNDSETETRIHMIIDFI